MGAVVAAFHLGLSLSDIGEGLRAFQGVRRRTEVVGEVRGITVIDDFAHHPTAVRATLEAIRSRFTGGRLWAIFEPRTQTVRRGFLQRELALALGEADHVVIGKIPSPPVGGTGLDPHRLVHDIRGAKGSDAIYMEDPEEIVAHCAEGVRSGDVVVVMSSGYFAGLPGGIFNALKDSS
ncbi:MAG: UDP-N-acetylmuramate:L-alanyl-gamma-D-glutamyl-meso-diaminopimelate ligase, partial [Deltaproteobacteria bacterium]